MFLNLRMNTRHNKFNQSPPFVKKTARRVLNTFFVSRYISYIYMYNTVFNVYILVFELKNDKNNF